jgi:hypothetical protein
MTSNMSSMLYNIALHVQTIYPMLYTHVVTKPSTQKCKKIAQKDP